MCVKKILILLTLFFSNMALADVVITNKSSTYDMDVTYRFCKSDSNDQILCMHPDVIRVKHSSNNEAGYTAIPVPVTDSLWQFVNITSVTQKDASGHIIVQSNYAWNDTESSCGSSTVGYNSDNEGMVKKRFAISSLIALEDHSPLAMITCHSETSDVKPID